MTKIYIKDEIDPEVEEQNRLYEQYKMAKETGTCPECGSAVNAFEVTASRDPADCDIDGVRAGCRKCGWKVCLDF